MAQSQQFTNLVAETGAPRIPPVSFDDVTSRALIKRYVGMSTLPEFYSPLFLEASKRSIFFSQPWFQNFDRTVVDEPTSTRIYGVEIQQQGRSNRPIGALLLRTDSKSRWGIAPRVFEGLSNYYTALYGPVLGSDRDESAKAVELIVEALNNDRREWDVVNLRPLNVNDPEHNSLSESFHARNMVTQTYLCFGNWYLDVQGRSYVDYLSGLSSVLRKNIPYAARKLERTSQVRYVLITSHQGLEQGLQDYEKVYRVSWRDKAEPYPGFIPGLVRTAAGQGWLRLGVLYLDDEPAAAQLWLTHSGIASIYKICYDERFSKLSVGTVLTAKMMEQALDVDKVREVDYLGGDEPYKSAWMSHRRERWGMMVFNPLTIRGLGQILRHVGGRSLKKHLRRLVQGRVHPNSLDHVNVGRDF